VAGKTAFDIYSREAAEKLSANDRKVIESRCPLQSEEEAPHTGPGGTRTYISNKFLLSGMDGQPYALCGISTDITDRKLLEDRQRAAKEQAESANRTKDEFLAIVSHELRTPLTPIIGWSQMLLNKPLDDRTRLKGLKAIERNARAQSSLIEDLLDISRIVTGKIKLDCKAVALAQVVEAAIDAVKPMAVAKSIRIEFSPHDSKGESIGPLWGDPNRLQQVVWNLLTNAVKFTPKNGSVEVCLQRSGNLARIVVRDSGEGIAPEYLPRMFERFSQFDYSTTRKHGGLGIGLSVVRQIVELHGGRAFAESEGLGKGAAITVELPIPEHVAAQPLKPVSNGSAIPNGARTLQGKLILVVDDESDAREFLKIALNSYGAEVITAASAGEALEKLRSDHPDLLVSDIGMPGEDGYALIRAVRGLSIHIPAIAVTAFARSEDAARALQEGFQRHLSKPVEPEELCTALAELSA
jgi:signal transduction histidine kinase